MSIIKKLGGRPFGSQDSFKRVRKIKYEAGTKTMWVRLEDDKFNLVRLAKLEGLSAADIIDYALSKIVTKGKGLKILKYKGTEVARLVATKAGK